MIKEGQNIVTYDTGAKRATLDADGNAKGRMDLIPWEAVLMLSHHCEEGAKIYGEHSAENGLKQSSFCDSGMRHLAKYMAGWTDENHLLAACWNLMMALQQTKTHPEMIDIPWFMKAGDME